MIHGIYIKRNAKSKWHLISKAASLVMAEKDVLNVTLEQHKAGNKDIRVAIQTYESDFHIPEFLSNIKEQKLLYN